MSLVPKAFAMVLLASLLCMAWGQKAHPRGGRAHSSGRELGRRLSTVKGKRLRARAELHQTVLAAHGVKLAIVAVDAKLERSRASLEETQRNLAKAKLLREQADRRLDRATAQLAATRSAVRERIRRIYVDGNESALSTLSGRRTGGEVAAQSFLMRSIERKDREVFERYRTLQAQVSRDQREATHEVTQVRDMESAQTREASTLANQRTAKADLLSELQKKKKDLEQMIAQFGRDEVQIGREIDSFERMAAARRRHGVSGGGTFSGRFRRPVEAPILSSFGMRYHPILHRVRMHTGVDFGAGFGEPIHAAAAGEVIFASVMGGYGHVVIVEHGGGYSTVYAHASRVLVSVGERVVMGQVIALVGQSGLATGPHLHFELRYQGRPINPLAKIR